MPHVIVKLWPGRNDEIKGNLAKRIANTVAEELNVDMGDVSVAIEEVPREEWGEKYIRQKLRIIPIYIISRIMSTNEVCLGMVYYM